MKQIYLDYAAITPVSKNVEKRMLAVQRSFFGNPSSLHAKGVDAKHVLDESRGMIAEVLHCRPQEILFTSGGTESANMAILGVMRHALHSKTGTLPHAITTNIEHHAVLNPCKELEREGATISYVAVSKNGIVSVRDIISAIRPETVLVSVMYANNEIGTIQPIAALGKELKKINKQRAAIGLSEILFHSDACQAAGFLDLNVHHLGIDLCTLNGSKMYGPRHTGILYVRQGVVIEPILYGGGQERGLRSGTEDVAAAAGFAMALQQVNAKKDKESLRQLKLRYLFFELIAKHFPDAIVNGATGEHRLPNNINVSLQGSEGESMIIYLSSQGVYCSTGSACSTAQSQPSHVLLAISDNSMDRATTSLRFSIGNDTTSTDIRHVVDVLQKVYQQMRYTVDR
jgi:cysteine desulfurase